MFPKIPELFSLLFNLHSQSTFSVTLFNDSVFLSNFFFWCRKCICMYGLLGEGMGWKAGSLRVCLYWILFLLLVLIYDQRVSPIFFHHVRSSKNPVLTGSQREIGIFPKDISLKAPSPWLKSLRIRMLVRPLHKNISFLHINRATFLKQEEAIFLKDEEWLHPWGLFNLFNTSLQLTKSKSTE